METLNVDSIHLSLTCLLNIKNRKRPRYITTLSILLGIFGISYFFTGIYILFLLDYVSEIILYVNATSHVFFAVGLLKGKKCALKGTIILSILNLVYSLILLSSGVNKFFTPLR